VGKERRSRGRKSRKKGIKAPNRKDGGCREGVIFKKNHTAPFYNHGQLTTRKTFNTFIYVNTRIRSCDEMGVITVRVDDELKKLMEKLKYINWSEVVRQAITRVIEREEEKNQALAVLLNEESIVVPDKGYDSVDVIREWRETIRWKS